MTANSGFSISKFKGGAKKGFLSPAKYELVISNIPAKVLENYKFYFKDDNRAVTDQIKFHCEAATLPGVSLNVHQFRPYGYGVNETRPVHPIYQKLNVSLYADSEGKLWKFIHSWISTIANHGSKNTSWETKSNNLTAYQLNYRDDYAAGIVNLYQYDNSGNRKLDVRMTNVFPIVLGDINVNWGLSSQLMKIPVVFSYFDWYEGPIGTEKATEDVRSAPDTGSSSGLGSGPGGADLNRPPQL